MRVSAAVASALNIYMSISTSIYIYVYTHVYTDVYIYIYLRAAEGFIATIYMCLYMFIDFQCAYIYVYGFNNFCVQSKSIHINMYAKSLYRFLYVLIDCCTCHRTFIDFNIWFIRVTVYIYTYIYIYIYMYRYIQ